MAKAPTVSGVWMHSPRPNPWNTGRIASTLFPGLIPVIACIETASALKLDDDSSMPFGRAEVPPLNSTTLPS